MNQAQFAALLAELQRTNELLAALLAAVDGGKAAKPGGKAAKAKAKPKPGDGAKVA
jgi:hypothetical protein